MLETSGKSLEGNAGDDNVKETFVTITSHHPGKCQCHPLPMFHIISYYRTILYDKQIPNMSHVFILLIACLSILIIGYLIFQKCKKRFAEEL